MTDKDTMEIFEKAPVPTAVLKNTVPAMVAMMMVLVYNLADTLWRWGLFLAPAALR